MRRENFTCRYVGYKFLLYATSATIFNCSVLNKRTEKVPLQKKIIAEREFRDFRPQNCQIDAINAKYTFFIPKWGKMGDQVHRPNFSQVFPQDLFNGFGPIKIGLAIPKLYILTQIHE